MEIKVKVRDPRVLGHGLPENQTVGSAGLDLRVFLEGDQREVRLNPGEAILLDTGINIYIGDPNYAGFMFARSGLGHKGVVLGNGTGIIDSDYQGPLKISLLNRSTRPITIESGERVAQLVIMPVASGYKLKVVNDFGDTTARGEGGFGSTGTK